MAIILNEAAPDDGVGAALSALIEAAAASPKGYTPEELHGMIDAVVLGEGLMDKLTGAALDAVHKAHTHLAARAAEKSGDHLTALMLRNPKMREEMEREKARANSPEGKRADAEHFLKMTGPHHNSSGVIGINGTTFHHKDGVIHTVTED
jgi:hypothetical protein